MEAAQLAPDTPRRAVIPRATYRLQLHAGFKLREALDLVPYLDELGISHVYCSPLFKARAGSLHGYDVVDHGAFNPEILRAEEFTQFVAALRARGMGVLLDVVPNHVGVMGAQNVQWMDVLENGPAARHARVFDIDWYPPNPVLAGRLLVPVLGAAYGDVLEQGELVLRFEPDTGGFAVFYHEHRFPLDPHTYPLVLERALAECAASEPAAAELGALRATFAALPDRMSDAADLTEVREAESGRARRQLARLASEDAAARAALDGALRELNGAPGDAASFDALHALLEQQAYRLAHWRTASDDINYRRFFDVNELAAMRVEDPEVFAATSGFALHLVSSGEVDGLRVDHPDGLYDPAQYFRRLHEGVAGGPAKLSAALSSARGARQRGAALPFYLLAEKITARFERLPREWLIHGTTGYRFANLVNGLFVDGRARLALDRTYRAFIGDYADWPDVVYESKTLIMRTALAAEINVLANQLLRIAQHDRHTRDFTLNTLRAALIETIAWFPVYRTYVGTSVSDADRHYIDWALARVRRRGPTAAPGLFDFVRSALLAEPGAARGGVYADVQAFSRRFQQVTSPVTAKGVEDTALYRFTRLTSLNDVGGEPDAFGVTVRQFHRESRERARDWPHEMLATSTHDTKRSEDVRARIDVLSEWPRQWRRSLARWSRMNRARRRIIDDLPAPGPHAEHLLYQTLLGTWPVAPFDDAGLAAYRVRIEDYMIKAMREAKRRTSWLNVNEEYEEALRQFIRGALERADGSAFVQEVSAFAQQVARIGLVNSLAMTLCKLTSPGVPDIYQGNELLDLSLVDPDNRRPVDYIYRRRLLAEQERRCPFGAPAPAHVLDALLADLGEGSAKLFVVAHTLAFRRRHATLFRDGAYTPVYATGAAASHVCAFVRADGEHIALTIVPRLTARLGFPPLGEPAWRDTRLALPAKLAPGAWRCVLTGARHAPLTHDGELRLAEVLARFPVALLTPLEEPGPAALETGTVALAR